MAVVGGSCSVCFSWPRLRRSSGAGGRLPGRSSGAIAGCTRSARRRRIARRLLAAERLRDDYSRKYADYDEASNSRIRYHSATGIMGQRRQGRAIADYRRRSSQSRWPGIRLGRLWTGAHDRDRRYSEAFGSIRSIPCVTAPRCRRRRAIDQIADYTAAISAPGHRRLQLVQCLSRRGERNGCGLQARARHQSSLQTATVLSASANQTLARPARCSWMKSRRGSTSSPISLAKMSSASSIP